MFHCNHCNFPTQHNNLNTISCACIPTHNNVQQPYYYFLCMYLYTKKYFHIGNRKGNIALCQIRTEASNLNLHLYDHHFTDRINCPNCYCLCYNIIVNIPVIKMSLSTRKIKSIFESSNLKTDRNFDYF
jgi:hypothetical protein